MGVTKTIWSLLKADGSAGVRSLSFISVINLTSLCLSFLACKTDLEVEALSEVNEDKRLLLFL